MNPINALKYGVMQDYPGSFYNSAVDDSTGQQFDLRKVSSVPPPCGGAATPAGTTGATTYTYQLTGVKDGLETLPCAAFSTTTGNATLSTTDYNRITAYIAFRDYDKVNVYRTVGGATTGIIGSVVPGDMDPVTGAITFDDTGLAGGSESVPTSNATSTKSAAAGCHRVTVANYGPNVALVHLSSAKNATIAAAEATRDFAAGFNSTTKYGRIFRVRVGENPDFLLGVEVTFVKVVAEDSSGTCDIVVTPGRA